MTALEEFNFEKTTNKSNLVNYFSNLPRQIIIFLKYVKELTFYDEPDYKFLIQMF